MYKHRIWKDQHSIINCQKIFELNTKSFIYMYKPLCPSSILIYPIPSPKRIISVMALGGASVFVILAIGLLTVDVYSYERPPPRKSIFVSRPQQSDPSSPEQVCVCVLLYTSSRQDFIQIVIRNNLWWLLVVVCVVYFTIYSFISCFSSYLGKFFSINRCPKLVFFGSCPKLCGIGL